jgi:hypothetical protein
MVFSVFSRGVGTCLEVQTSKPESIRGGALRPVLGFPNMQALQVCEIAAAVFKMR